MSPISLKGKVVASLCAAPFLLVLGACSALAPSETNRGVVEIESAEAQERSVTLVVDSCNSDPVAEVAESDSTVNITVTANIYREGPACLDTVDVVLEEVLGDRILMDTSNNSVVSVTTK